MTYRSERTEVKVDPMDVIPSTSIWALGIVVGSCAEPEITVKITIQ